MIISASYKTDIPTFYGEWFIRRLRAGYCMAVNAFNQRAYRVSLDRASADGFVFWTKNVHPFLKHLPEVRDSGFPFIVQHTINGYPRELETATVDATRAVEAAWKVREMFGPLALVWRYDTIVATSLTPAEFHVENFQRLAAQLEGATNEVVISFAQMYKKTKRNLDAAASERSFSWHDPTSAEKRELLKQLLRIAARHRMQLTVCSQPDLVTEGSQEARCIDARRLQQLAGGAIQARLKGSRKECGCFESRDIGEYDTCPHGCVYCYAVQQRELAVSRYKEHRPDSEFLFEPPAMASSGGRGGGGQLKLFDG
jgi:hypothetical protein